jgi:hypothetical protein
MSFACNLHVSKNKHFMTYDIIIIVHARVLCVGVCVCVCEREREREREHFLQQYGMGLIDMRERERAFEITKMHSADPALA